MKKTFEQWMKEVDTHTLKLRGVTSADLEDICYRDLYDDGKSPLTAAKKAIKNSEDY